ncbi:MAG: DUF3488 and transglutaminase-like domain-containing protein [Mariprofundus sp.]
MTGARGLRVERLTLAVLLCGVASLALSDFVSPLYWSLPVGAALLRLWRGPSLYLTEMQASLVGWLGFAWVILEIFFGRALVIAFTDFLLILAFAVVIEAATARNHLHRMLVGLFLLLAAAVLTDSFLYALPLLAMAWFLWRAAACLYGLNRPGGDLPGAAVRQDMYALVLLTVLAASLFVALPRFEFHSLLAAMQPRQQTSGFTDTVQLGDFARQLDTQVVLRVEPAERSPLQLASFRHLITGRYWRGATLSRFTGSAWQKGSGGRFHQYGADADITFAQQHGMRVSVYREASDHAYVLWPDNLLGLHAVPETLRVNDRAEISFVSPPARRLRLLMDLSQGHSQSVVMRAPLAEERDTSHTPPALRQWTLQVGGSGDAGERLNRIASELRSWQYDLNVAVDGSHPLVSFLQIRRGHCEFYATTLALAARELGLPARVVNGYYRGEWNQAGSFLLMRQLHAHSWVEIWMDGHWQRMDATPAARWQLSYLRFPSFDAVWESARLAWYRYVLAFSSADRLAVVDQLWLLLKQYALYILLVVMAVPLLLLCYRGARQLLLKMQVRRNHLWPLLDRWLKMRGIYRLPHQPLRGLAVPDGINPERWYQFVSAWEMQAYGTAPGWHRRELQRQIGALSQRY